MARLLAIALVAALTAAACSGGDDGDSATETPSPTPIVDAAQAARSVLVNMIGLRSYHMEIAFSPVGAPIPNYVDYEDGDYFERIPADLSNGGGEYVFAGGHTYVRTCTNAGACTAWQRLDGQPYAPSLAGSVNSVPETLALTTLDTAADWEVVPGADAPTLRAAVNVNEAMQENHRRVLALSGLSDQDIEAVIEEAWGNVAPVGEESVVEAKLTADGSLLTKLTIFLPGDPSDPYFEVEYSNFNDVTVEAPD